MMDPIADMLTRIRNASAVRKADVVLPMSKIKLSIAKILERTGWIEKAEVIKAINSKNEKASFDELHLVLKYKENGRPAITSLKRVSRSSRRIYVGSDSLPRVLNNYGIAILSTSHGLMTNKEAGMKGIGGEVICEIY